MVKLDIRARKRRSYIRLFVALGVGSWLAAVLFMPRTISTPIGSCAWLSRAWMEKQQRFFDAHGRYTPRPVELEMNKLTHSWQDLILVGDPNGTVLKHFELTGSFLTHDTVLVSSRRAASAPPSVLPAVAAGGERIGLTGACPNCSITLACIENLDEDSDFSVWTISSHDRVTERGEMIRAGSPYLEHDDAEPLDGAPAYAELIR